MAKILVNLPQQTYILKNFYTLGLKDAPCFCDECGAAIKNVCVVQGTADKQLYKLGTTCVEKHSKKDTNFLTSASQYKLKMAKKSGSNVSKFIKLYKDVSSNPDILDKFLTVYISEKVTNKGKVKHAEVALVWLFDPDAQTEYNWATSYHSKDRITIDLAWVDVTQNSELKEIFSNTKWEYPVADDFSNEAVVNAYEEGYKDPEFQKTWSNNHFDWFLKTNYEDWYKRSE